MTGERFIVASLSGWHGRRYILRDACAGELGCARLSNTVVHAYHIWTGSYLDAVDFDQRFA